MVAAACPLEESMNSRQLTKEEVVLQAIQSRRAFAEAVPKLPLPVSSKERHGIRALIDPLLAGQICLTSAPMGQFRQIA
jgi:hypothetical protein